MWGPAPTPPGYFRPEETVRRWRGRPRGCAGPARRYGRGRPRSSRRRWWRPLDPAHRRRGMGGGGEVVAALERVHGRGGPEKALADPGEPVGIGAEGQTEALERVEPLIDRLGRRAIDQERVGRQLGHERRERRERLARAQARAVRVHHRHGEPDRQVGLARRHHRPARLIDRGHGLEQQQVGAGRDGRHRLGIDGGGLRGRGTQIGAVGLHQRPDRPGDAPRPVRIARGAGGGHGVPGEHADLIRAPHPREPVAQGGVGVGGGHRRPGGEIGRVHVAQQIRVVDHHLGRPERRRPVAGPRDELLPDGAVEKREWCHCWGVSGISTSFPAWDLA